MKRKVTPQSGPQTRFLKSSADIAIYGGGAGGGKTWALLLEAMRHRLVADFRAVVFRRNLVQVKNPGGLWDESVKLYGPAGAKPRIQTMEWRFPSGARIKFAHLEHENTVLDWQGAQVPLICFDELTHFSRAQFFYMLSRNRSVCGVKPYVRATCNPDSESWVADFIAWWIDAKTGLPIPERAGVPRWFVRVGDSLVWADRSRALYDVAPDIAPKSVTFVPARLDDNPALVEADPGYRANLLALPTVERERLLSGNWKIRPAGGLYFQRLWCEIVDAAPAGLKCVRYWDLAATPKRADNDPDWSVGVKLGRDENGFYFLLDAIRFRDGPGEVERIVKATAAQDGKTVKIGLPQDPGQAGKMQAAYFIRQLAGYDVTAHPESGDKVTRFGPFSAQTRAGNVRIVRGAWNEDFLAALEGFPDGAHDDDADAASGAFQMFQTDTSGLIDFYGRLAQRAHPISKETDEHG
jgi:predicted phage terminase large subunit-like protein